MKVVHYSDGNQTFFDNEVARGVAGRVLIGRDDGAGNFCMRLFQLAPEGYTPKHAHDWEHEIFIHAGQGAVFKKGEWVPVRSGHAVFIPGNEEHQIKNTGTDPLTFVCLIPSGPPEL